MSALVLGIESSCDETAAAVVVGGCGGAGDDATWRVGCGDDVGGPGASVGPAEGDRRAAAIGVGGCLARVERHRQGLGCAAEDLAGVS